MLSDSKPKHALHSLKHYFAKTVLATALCLSFNGNALAQSATGSALVEIRQVVAVAETSSLNFGVVSSGSADTITLSPDGSITSQNNADITVPNAQAGGFNAAGSPNSAITISFTGGSLAGTGAPMAINNLTHNGGANPQFDENGQLEFAVGADLQVNANQAPGIYTGTYQVSINYQ